MTEYPRLRRLLPRKTRPGEAGPTDIASAVDAAAKALARGKDAGQLQVSLVGKRRPNHYTFDVRDGDCRVTEARSEAPDLEIVVTDDVLLEMAEGTLSPVDAYLMGRMEVTGDIEFGKRQYAKLMERGTIENLPA